MNSPVAAGAFTRDLTVPGTVAPAAHVTMVSVAAPHRRQGLLNRMLAEVHADAVRRSEAIAVLWASEGRIYQRYGYGLAARKAAIETTLSEITFLGAGAPDRVRSVTLDGKNFADVYDRVRVTRPGWSSRDERWWAYRLADLPSNRNGASKLRAVVHDGPDGPDGYLIWRVQGNWSGGGPNGEVRIHEVAAETPEAYRALVQFAFSMDLTRTLSWWAASVDEPIQYAVSSPARLAMRVSEALWIRVLDVPAALEARRYAAPADLVIEVTDAGVPANNGRFRLTTAGSGGTATCVRVDEPADVACEIRALGAAYLGGVPLGSLVTAGPVQEITPGSLASLSAALSWHQAPSAIEVF